MEQQSLPDFSLNPRITWQDTYALCFASVKGRKSTPKHTVLCFRVSLNSLLAPFNYKHTLIKASWSTSLQEWVK